jgi:hypothetical protein
MDNGQLKITNYEWKKMQTVGRGFKFLIYSLQLLIAYCLLLIASCLLISTIQSLITYKGNYL